MQSGVQFKEDKTQQPNEQPYLHRDGLVAHTMFQVVGLCQFIKGMVLDAPQRRWPIGQITLPGTPSSRPVVNQRQ